MKIWMLHNLGLKIFSVILATVIWMLINGSMELRRETPASDHFQRVPTLLP